MDYVADFMEHLIEHPSIRAKSTTKWKRELFTSEPVNSSLVEQHLLSRVKNFVDVMLHPKLLKASAPVSRKVNSTIIWCSYPVRRKMGQVTSLIKGDELSMKNYPAAGDCITTYKQHL